jgi:hypothetical protein
MDRRTDREHTRALDAMSRLVLCALLMGMLLVSHSVVEARPLGPSACGIIFPDIEGSDICYSVAHVHRAERRMGSSLVRPGQVVWRLTGMRLRRVMLRVVSTPPEIDYLFGRMPLAGTPDLEPCERCERPHYVLLTESPSMASSPYRPPRHYTGYWFSWRNVRCVHTYFAVSTNTTAAIARSVLREWTGRARCAH